MADSSAEKIRYRFAAIFMKGALRSVSTVPGWSASTTTRRGASSAAAVRSAWLCAALEMR